MPNGSQSPATARFPVGLTYSAVVGAVSLGLLTLLGGLGTHGGRGPAPLVHTSAGLCLAWSLIACFVSRHAHARAHARDELLSVLQMGALVTGLLAAIVLIYAATIEVLIRTIYFDYDLPWRVAIWRTGAVDIAVMAAAALLSWSRGGRRPHGQLVTAAFWITVLGGLWLSFSVPAVRHMGAPGAGYVIPSAWASWFMLAAALIIGVFTIYEGWLAHHRRCGAWPAALGDLVTPAPVWPGFDLSAGIVAVLILTLGCAYVVLPWTAIAGLVAGGSLLVLVNRRWNENLADAGLALITLGVVSLCMLGLSPPVWSADGYAAVLNRALIGLAVMTGIWHWLIRVWAQQLDDGRPWTTSGRLIRTARRVGFLIACTGVMVSLHLTLWPNLPFVLDLDNSNQRWIAALSGNTTMLLALLAGLRGTRRSTVGWLAMLTVSSAIGFALVRAPDSRLGSLIVLHWPIALTGGAGLCLLLAWALSRFPSWQALQEPLVITGVLLAPMGAITGVTLTDAAILGRVPLWVPAGTFGGLALVYALAAIYPGPFTFATVTALCSAVGLWHLQDLTAHQYVPEPYFYALLSGLCLWLIGVTYQTRGRPATMRILRWLGGGLALVSLVAGWLLGR